ncbi:hypothetical protein HOY82DRAFT_672959 [Tuber indicum]|nr:hypothetical protein HOY82DRAFT_672959 [Tuber indicum]
MKLPSIAAIASLVATVSAQTFPDIPQCARICIEIGFPGTGCSPNDLSCACSNTQFVSGTAACIRDTCPPAESLRILASAVALCRANGISIPSTFPGSGPTTAPTSATSIPATTTQTTIFSTFGATSTMTRPTTSRPTAIPTGAVAGNRTANATRATSAPTFISGGSERLTTALSVIGLSIAAAYFSL